MRRIGIQNGKAPAGWEIVSTHDLGPEGMAVFEMLAPKVFDNEGTVYAEELLNPGCRVTLLRPLAPPP